MPRRLLILCLFLAFATGVTSFVWRFSAAEALARLEERGSADLRLAADRLNAHLQRFRAIAVLMADHPSARAMADGAGGATDLESVEPGAAEPGAADLDRLLLSVVDTSGLLSLTLVTPEGKILAASDGRRGQMPLTPDLIRARQGALGLFHAVDPATARRYFSYAAPVFAPEGAVAGALLLRLDVEGLEAAGRGDAMPVWFVDDQGVVFVTNRDEMRFRQLQQSATPDPAIYPAGLVRPFVSVREYAVAGRRLWRVHGGPYLPARALPLTRPLPVISMTSTALVDAAPALRYAALQAAVAAALSFGFGAVLMALGERRRALTERLADKARANAALEARVQERTAALQEANDQLTRAQADLVQAGKLSALGQMSAGISHELNQPLMAIGSYAENAGLYLERGRSAEAAQNLTRISELARRMGRIIKNLRAFARQESEPMRDVDMVAVIASALELVQPRLDRAGVSLHWHQPSAPVLVRGGEVRLGQVVINLLSNAADAMAASPRRDITLTLTREAARVRLMVADTGPGITEPGRIFDPFYSTKEVGSAEGMGLGLSISYGLVQSFGGAITGQNRPDGGAVFTVELDAVTSDRKKEAR